MRVFDNSRMIQREIFNMCRQADEIRLNLPNGTKNSQKLAQNKLLR